MSIVKTFVAGAAFALIAAPVMAKTPTGAQAPDFNVIDSNGASHSLSDFRGKNVVLEWTNHKCPYVVKHYSSDNMQGTQKEVAGTDTVWLSVISSAAGKQGHVSGAKANSLTADRGAAPTAVILDESGEMGLAYDAKTTPHMYIINPEGTLVYQGAIDSNRSSSAATIPGATNYVKAAMADIAAGNSVGANDTQPYGCTIKY